MPSLVRVGGLLFSLPLVSEAIVRGGAVRPTGKWDSTTFGSLESDAALLSLGASPPEAEGGVVWGDEGEGFAFLAGDSVGGEDEELFNESDGASSPSVDVSSETDTVEGMEERETAPEAASTDGSTSPVSSPVEQAKESQTKLQEKQFEENPLLMGVLSSAELESGPFLPPEVWGDLFTFLSKQWTALAAWLGALGNSVDRMITDFYQRYDRRLASMDVPSYLLDLDESTF
uniref:Uncharacterized protein n=1 Tax=Chromera velia CCMP2878 TaxID=1169474 RepID=A0A0G4GHM0_9ALVE|eukprot:Cvel_21915.t1-p1 / transcript=Cvel_21915.t1 / gene=Cvel_21915 / organism=Chromera_velia_CCMP2878 / gene_product=hypothetical protein / transcript_product=hypothetical protein / location=Cvel_scaffold2100:27722-29390(+) / protein_length=230 / sequence_SO=supercontig / SO=protein_coding / is_pseudo=false